MGTGNDKMKIADLKQLYRECDTFFICSTQNQIVNFIPIVNMLEAKAEGEKKSEFVSDVTLYNLTYSTDARFSNNKWNENLNKIIWDKKGELFKKNPDLSIGYSKIDNKGDSPDKIAINVDLDREYSEDYYNNIIKHIEGKKNIIWNLTGGQRSVLLTVLKIIEDQSSEEQNHTILYMEGNTNRFVVGTYQKGEKKGIYYRELDTIYGWEHLTIEMVFGLAGFQAQCSKAIRLYKNQMGKKGIMKKVAKESPYDEELCSEREDIKKFYEYYKTYDLVESLLETQNDKTSEIAEKERGKIWQKLENIEKKDDVDRCKSRLEGIGGKTKYKLGYWLEYMLYYQLEMIIKDEEKYQNYFLELGHSVKLDKENQEEEEKKEKEKFSEFDVVLLSKSGQIIIFECKTGAITSEVSKARIYTSYAAAGVYGTPILIPPYLNDDENDKVQNASEGVWGKMNKTRKAAERAGMDIWYLDTLKEDIDELYKEVGLVEE